MPKHDDKQQPKATKPKREKIKSYRRRDRHERNISKAAERRASETYTVPMNAMVPLSALPPKAQDKIIREAMEAGIPAPDPVPDPKRGKKLKGRELSDALARREDQARKIAAKADQRRHFATLPPRAKAEARAAGREHRRPRVIR